MVYCTEMFFNLEKIPISNYLTKPFYVVSFCLLINIYSFRKWLNSNRIKSLGMQFPYFRKLVKLSKPLLLNLFTEPRFQEPEFISQLLYTIIPATPGQTKNYHFPYTVKKENNFFLICKEIQKGSVAKSYMRIEEGPNI